MGVSGVVGVSGFLANLAELASVICYTVAALGCGYALFAAWSARSFVRAAPLQLAANFPAVTILKPLHGAEPTLYGNLAGFCVQDYPGPVQIVFGVADAADPAIGIVRKLMADFPGFDFALVVSPASHGVNGKVSNLINMLDAARYDALVISDSDIIVASDYLRHVTAALDGAGLVTCLYRGAAANGIWSRLAAAAIDYHFLPSALVGLKLGLATPCFGATIALRRQTLAEIGGFEAVADQLADDYALGALARRAGLTVAIPRYAVTHVCSEGSAHELFTHELRWSRTIRSVDTLGFAGLVVTHALPLALLGMLLGGMTPAVAVVGVALACRLLLQRELDRAFHLRDGLYWMGPVRDVVSFAVFVASFFGRGVEWGGSRYGVRADNSLVYYGEVKS